MLSKNAQSHSADVALVEQETRNSKNLVKTVRLQELTFDMKSVTAGAKNTRSWVVSLDQYM